MLKLRLRDRLLWGLAVGGEIVEQIAEGGSRAYHHSKLFSWTPPGYSKKKYRDLVNRMEREGYIQKVLLEKEVNFRITGKGRRQLTKLYPVLGMVGQTWDGFWRVVIFDVPEKRRQVRDLLRRQLKLLGFAKLQNSTYVSAYDYDKTLLDYLQAKGLAGRVLLMEAKQKHLGDPKQLANKVWGLEELKRDYEKIIDRLTTRFGIADKRKREEFLKRVYQDYLEVLLRDPFLPKELLPANWPYEKAKKYILRAGVVRE